MDPLCSETLLVSVNHLSIFILLLRLHTLSPLWSAHVALIVFNLLPLRLRRFLLLMLITVGIVVLLT